MQRKLKTLSARKPSEKVQMRQFAKEISKRTGYTVHDITEVWRVGIDIIIEYIKAGKSVVLPKIGMLFPMIKPPRKVMSMNGGIGVPEAMVMAARWVLRFQPGKTIKEILINHPVSEKDLENQYED